MKITSQEEFRALRAGRTSPAQLAHVVMRTGQYEAMVDWYAKVLDADIVFANDQITFLTYDDEHHRVAISRLPVVGKRSKARAGVDHVAFTYADIATLLNNWERLSTLGICPIWTTNHGPTTSMYYQDPDGNVLELQVDNFRTLDELEHWAETSDFQENPIGVDFDPAELKRRLENGESESTLLARPRIGKRSGATVPSEYLGGFVSTLAKIASAAGKKV